MTPNRFVLRIRLMVFLCIAGFAVACTASSGVSSAPGASADTVAAESPSATHDPAPTASAVIETDPPITYPPDNMWGFLSTSAGTPSGATNVQEAAALSDVVVVGRFVGVEQFDGYGAPGEGVGWYAVALIDIDSTLKGSPSLGDDGLLRVPFLLALGAPESEAGYPEKEFADLSRSIPSDPALLFLRTWAAYFDRAGTEVPDWLADLNRTDIYRTIGADGAIRMVDGVLQPMPYSETWDSTLEGLRVEDLGL